MNIKRLKHMMKGCKFKPGTTECHVDDNDIVHITETCMECGKKFTFSVPMLALERCAEDIHLLNERGEL